MGANKNKGLAFNWLLDHVRDGQEKGYPRALVRLIEQAAINEREIPKATHNRLLHPTSLRRAIEGVSKLQVTQARANEWPWIEGLRSRLNSEIVPMKRTELEYLLKKDWEGSWNSQKQVSPPVPDSRGFARYLVEIAVLRERSKDRPGCARSLPSWPGPPPTWRRGTCLKNPDYDFNFRSRISPASPGFALPLLSFMTWPLRKFSAAALPPR
jgi:hypothetical protein